MTPVAHGQDGWSLVNYEWSAETGTAELTYERSSASGRVTDVRVIERPHLLYWTPGHAAIVDSPYYD